MEIRQLALPPSADDVRLETALAALAGFPARLLLLFGSVSFFARPGLVGQLQAVCPEALLLGCSSAGDIAGASVLEQGATLTAIAFDDTPLKAASVPLARMEDSFAAGAALATRLQDPALAAVLVLGPGLAINGSALVNGLASVLGTAIPVTGGLAGDGGQFVQTLTLGPEGMGERNVVALGLYGDKVRLAHGCFGGWEVFGPARKVTRSVGNVLYELDGQPALSVYKRYLGSYADKLPGSGLLFPFAMLGSELGEAGLIRTILAVDEAEGSLVLAGEIHEGGQLKLMHASTDRLVTGAEQAATAVCDMWQGLPGAVETQTGLALLVSCVGRKLVMGDRVEEEVEAVQGQLRQKLPQLTLNGFYSYGEISPFLSGEACHLHNQTMTITLIGEVPVQG